MRRLRPLGVPCLFVARALLVVLPAALVAIGAAACAPQDEAPTTATTPTATLQRRRLHQGPAQDRDRRYLHGRHRQAGLRAVVRPTTTRRNGKGYESAVAYAVADKLGFAQAEVKWVVVPFTNAYAPGDKKFDFDINQVSITEARQKAVDFSSGYYDVAQTVVTTKGSPDRRRQDHRRPQGRQAGRPGRHDHLHRDQRADPADQEGRRLRHQRPRGPGPEERPDRRHRGRPADRVLHDRGPARRRRDRRPAARRGGTPEQFGAGAGQGQPADRPASARPSTRCESDGTLDQAGVAVAVGHRRRPEARPEPRRSVSPVEHDHRRGSRRRSSASVRPIGGGGRSRSTLIAVVSTVVRRARRWSSASPRRPAGRGSRRRSSTRRGPGRRCRPWRPGLWLNIRVMLVCGVLIASSG